MRVGSARWTAPRIVRPHVDAAVRGDERVPARGLDGIAGEDVDLLAHDLQPAILGDEAARMERAVETCEAGELGHVDWRAERDHRGVDRDRPHRRDRAPGGTATVGKARGIELLEADLLAG